MLRLSRLSRLFVLAQSAVMIYGAVKAARAAWKSSEEGKKQPVKRLPAPRRPA
jgi:hypothetical protein